MHLPFFFISFPIETTSDAHCGYRSYLETGSPFTQASEGHQSAIDSENAPLFSYPNSIGFLTRNENGDIVANQHKTTSQENEKTNSVTPILNPNTSYVSGEPLHLIKNFIDKDQQKNVEYESKIEV